MKKFIFTILIMVTLLIPVSLYAADVSDADYRGNIIGTNDSTAAETVSGNVSISTDDWITADILNSAATNFVVYDSSGTVTPAMPGYGTNPFCIYAGDISANGSKTFRIYTGNVSGGKTYYIPGPTGMSVTDNSTIEPGDNFSIPLTKVMVNTDNGSNKYLAHKENALDLYISGTISEKVIGHIRYNYPTVAAENGGNDTTDQTNHVVNLPAGISVDDLLIAIFTTDGATSITFPAGWTQLYSKQDGGNSFNQKAFYRIADGTEAATVNATTGSAQMTSHTTYRITGYCGVPKCGTATTAATGNPDPPNLTASWGTDTNLWFAICGYDDGTKTVNAYPGGYGSGRNDRANNAAGVGAGVAYKTATAASDNPGTFTLSAGVWDIANTLVVRGGPAVEFTGLSSGEYDIELYADSTNLTMSIDGVQVDTTSLNGCSVPDNANNWYFCYGSTVLYVDQIELEIAGVTQGQWGWEYAATFTDLSGHNHTGTPSFRTTCSDPDVTFTLENFEPLEQSAADYNPDLDWPSMISAVPDQPSSMYTENSTPGIFFAGLVHTLMTAAGVPESFFWYNFTFAIIIFAGILAFRIHPSLLLKVIVAMAIMIFWALPGLNVYGMFVVIYKGFWCFGILVLSKSYGW